MPDAISASELLHAYSFSIGGEPPNPILGKIILINHNNNILKVAGKGTSIKSSQSEVMPLALCNTFMVVFQ